MADKKPKQRFRKAGPLPLHSRTGVRQSPPKRCTYPACECTPQPISSIDGGGTRCPKTGKRN